MCFVLVLLQYYIGVYDSLNRIRDTYYKVYLNKLQERVEEQRKQIRLKSQALEDQVAKEYQVSRSST